jgi:hypothetical protein
MAAASVDAISAGLSGGRVHAVDATIAKRNVEGSNNGRILERTGSPPA